MTDLVAGNSAEYQALDGRVVRIQRREGLLKCLLLLQLVIAIATPVIAVTYLFPTSRERVANNFGMFSMLFVLLFSLVGFSAAMGIVAVYMQRSSSLLLAFVLQLICAAATTTAAFSAVVYIELVCQLVTLSESLRVYGNYDELTARYFCNSSVYDYDEEQNKFLDAIKKDRSLFLAVTIVYTICLAGLSSYTAYTALQLRFDILKAKYYHRRGWRGLLRMFSRAAAIHDNPHRLFNPSRELREAWERAEADKPPALRRQVYSLSNTDTKYRNRALTVTFLLDRAKHRKKVRARARASPLLASLSLLHFLAASFGGSIHSPTHPPMPSRGTFATMMTTMAITSSCPPQVILDMFRRRIVLESLVFGRKRSISISHVHSVRLLAEVADGDGSVSSVVWLTAERRTWCGADRVRLRVGRVAAQPLPHMAWRSPLFLRPRALLASCAETTSPAASQWAARAVATPPPHTPYVWRAHCCRPPRCAAGSSNSRCTSRRCDSASSCRRSPPGHSSTRRCCWPTATTAQAAAAAAVEEARAVLAGARSCPRRSRDRAAHRCASGSARPSRSSRRS